MQIYILVSDFCTDRVQFWFVEPMIYSIQIRQKYRALSSVYAAKLNVTRRGFRGRFKDTSRLVKEDAKIAEFVAVVTNLFRGVA